MTTPTATQTTLREAGNIHIGDTIYVKSLDLIGTVTRIEVMGLDGICLTTTTTTYVGRFSDLLPVVA